MPTKTNDCHMPRFSTGRYNHKDGIEPFFSTVQCKLIGMKREKSVLKRGAEMNQRYSWGHYTFSASCKASLPGSGSAWQRKSRWGRGSRPPGGCTASAPCPAPPARAGCLRSGATTWARHFFFQLAPVHNLPAVNQCFTDIMLWNDVMKWRWRGINNLIKSWK